MNRRTQRLLAIRLEEPAETLPARLGLSSDHGTRAELAAEVLERLSKRAGEGRRGWLYFGCVLALAGMEDAEEREFLLELQANTTTLTSPYFEQTALEGDADPEPAADAVAQSLQLQWVDRQVTALLDDADALLEQLRRGRLRYRSRRLRALVARTLRMEHALAAVGLPGRTTTLAQREEYDRWAGRYELDSRQNAATSKLAALNEIVRAYMRIGDGAAEHRLLRFEIALLALFPLVELGMYLLERTGDVP